MAVRLCNMFILFVYYYVSWLKASNGFETICTKNLFISIMYTENTDKVLFLKVIGYDHINLIWIEIHLVSFYSLLCEIILTRY